MIVNDLKDFIKRAERSRKYAPNSAVGMRVALGYFEKELNDEENSSLEKFNTNFNQIYQSVIRTNQDKLSASSLEVYKRRVFALLRDFTNYNDDPAKFVSWNPIRRQIIVKKKKQDKISSGNIEEGGLGQDDSIKNGMSKSEVPLRPGVKAVIWIPDDLNSEDVKKIRLYIDYLSSLAEES